MKNLLATSRDESNWKGRKLNLQLFAEGGGEGEGGAGEGEGGDPKDPNKTYTQEELDQLLQAETDRKVTKALDTAKSKWEKDLETTIDTKIKEAEKLLKMSEEEKQKHLLAEKEKEIADKEKAIAVRELKLTAIDILIEKKIPVSLVDMLLPADLSAETAKANIDTFEKAFREEVQKAVDERIKSTAPGAGGGGDNKDNIASIVSARNNDYKPELNPWG